MTVTQSSAVRLPPHSVEAEESVLGAMLLSEASVSDVLEKIRADDFYKPAHRKIFEAVVALFARGEAIDSVTVAEELRRNAHLEEIGGKPYLFHLVSSVPAASNASYYARIVEETALLRRLIEATQQAAAMAYESGDDVDHIVDAVEALVFSVAEKRLGDNFSHIRDLLHEQLEAIEALQERGGHLTGVPTGFLDLDNITNGFQGSNLIIVAARPSFGKCLSADAQIVVADGSVRTIEEIVREQHADLLTLGDDYKLRWTQAAAFVDDGVKPTYRITTRLGRTIVTTAVHPFLTVDGWMPLAELEVGTRIAVPRAIPAFGTASIGERQAKLLGYLIGDGCLTGSTVTFTQTDERVMADFVDAVTAFPTVTVHPEKNGDRAPAVRATTKRGQPNPLRDWLVEIGLMGCGSATKFVPDVIFTAPRDEVAAFLNRLFATDGWAPAAGARQIGYSSVSECLARQVQHLLLRFGINARVRGRLVNYNGTKRPSWQLEIIDIDSIRTFAREIGIFGKERAVEAVTDAVRTSQKKISDSIPAEAWKKVDVARGGRSWRSIGSEMGLGRRDVPLKYAGINMHVGVRSISRSRMGTFAQILDVPELGELATSDVYWDRIDSIEYAGEQQVYDLTIPDTHNFVANDICVHNTSLALNIAQQAATDHGTQVAIFSLEMSRTELVQRLVCSEALVDVSKLRRGNLSDQDWSRLATAVGRLADAPIYIDDTESVTVLEIRAKARRLKQKSGLGLIIIDYMQLMSGPRRSENRQQEISEVSRSLKILARELDVPVIAVSQLSRAVESRQDKRPMLADLRESGCLTADTQITRADNGQQVTMGELLRTGERDIPVWTLDQNLKLVPGLMTHVFASGTKEVFELRLRSGRSVKASANHPFFSAAGWTRLDEFSVGDAIAAARGVCEPALVSAAAGDRSRRLTEGTDVRPEMFWDEIAEIVPLGPQPVFDATVPGTANFLADGIIAHNSIEQDADIVMFIYRDEVYNPESTDKGVAELIVAKHRNGPVGRIKLTFLQQYTKFANYMGT
ncbi:MAG: replicative DNA helicase [Actinomycetota bacterium]